MADSFKAIHDYHRKIRFSPVEWRKNRNHHTIFEKNFREDEITDWLNDLEASGASIEEMDTAFAQAWARVQYDEGGAVLVMSRHECAIAQREYGTNGMKRKKRKKEGWTILFRPFRFFPFVPYSLFLLSHIA